MTLIKIWLWHHYHIVLWYCAYQCMRGGIGVRPCHHSEFCTMFQHASLSCVSGKRQLLLIVFASGHQQPIHCCCIVLCLRVVPAVHVDVLWCWSTYKLQIGGPHPPLPCRTDLCTFCVATLSHGELQYWIKDRYAFAMWELHSFGNCSFQVLMVPMLYS